MEHIVINHLPDGYARLTAEPGFRLYHIPYERSYSEVVTKEENINDFKAIENA